VFGLFVNRKINNLLPLSILFRFQAANVAKERLQGELDRAQFKVTQAQKVLTAVKQEVERWQQSGVIMDIKHQQVGHGHGGGGSVQLTVRKLAIDQMIL
jgi:hypothetical protein